MRRSLPWLFFYAALLRVAIALIPGGQPFDQACFKAWGVAMVLNGPAGFYEGSKAFFACDYPPLYMAWLGGWSWLYTRFDVTPLALTAFASFMPVTAFNALLKALVGLLDLLNGFLVYRILAPHLGPEKAKGAAILALFNPLFLYDAVYWGQIDTLLLTFMLGILWALTQGWLVRAGVLAALSLMLKPQALFLAPFFLAAQWFRHHPGRWLLTLAAGTMAVFVAIRPFWPHGAPLDSFMALYSRMTTTAQSYPYGAFNAFNLHGLFGQLRPDDATFLGLSQRVWGLVLLGLVQLAIAVVLFKRRDPATFWLGAATSVLAFFMFATRMHERYGIVALGILTLAYAYRPRLKRLYWTLCVVTIVNLVYAQDPNVARLLNTVWLDRILSLVSVVAFAMLIRELVRLAPPSIPSLHLEEPIPLRKDPSCQQQTT
ncbi:DUF2029 domain-containing protein [bacterium]|nr:DUF2029 domain-containing protein [bacterium]